MSGLKVRLHGRRQAARLTRDMLQRDLQRGNSVYMVGSCRARLLHIIHVSAVSEVGVLQEKCSRQPAPRGNYKFKLKMPPGLAAVARLLRAACRRVNAPVVFLCFYFAARLSRRSRAACRVPCKRSLNHIHSRLKCIVMTCWTSFQNFNFVMWINGDHTLHRIQQVMVPADNILMHRYIWLKWSISIYASERRCKRLIVIYSSFSISQYNNGPYKLFW